MAKLFANFTALAIIMAVSLVLPAAASRNLPKEKTAVIDPNAVVGPAVAPASDEKHFIAFGGVGGFAGIGKVVGLVPIGDLGGSRPGGLPTGGLGGLPTGGLPTGGLPTGGLGGDPGASGGGVGCGTHNGLAGAFGKNPVVQGLP